MTPVTPVTRGPSSKELLLLRPVLPAVHRFHQEELVNAQHRVVRHPSSSGDWDPLKAAEIVELSIYPLVMTNIAMERSTIFNGKIHYKWPFSIAMLNYQRVTLKKLHNTIRLHYGVVRSGCFWRANKMIENFKNKLRIRVYIYICIYIYILFITNDWLTNPNLHPFW